MIELPHSITIPLTQFPHKAMHFPQHLRTAILDKSLEGWDIPLETSKGEKRLIVCVLLLLKLTELKHPGHLSSKRFMKIERDAVAVEVGEGLHQPFGRWIADLVKVPLEFLLLGVGPGARTASPYPHLLELAFSPFFCRCLWSFPFVVSSVAGALESGTLATFCSSFLAIRDVDLGALEAVPTPSAATISSFHVSKTRWAFSPKGVEEGWSFYNKLRIGSQQQERKGQLLLPRQDLVGLHR